MDIYHLPVQPCRVALTHIFTTLYKVLKVTIKVIKKSDLTYHLIDYLCFFFHQVKSVLVSFQKYSSFVFRFLLSQVNTKITFILLATFQDKKILELKNLDLRNVYLYSLNCHCIVS